MALIQHLGLGKDHKELSLIFRTLHYGYTRSCGGGLCFRHIKPLFTFNPQSSENTHAQKTEDRG